MIIGAREDWPFKIVEEPNVTLLLQQARTQYTRFDEAWDGIVWLIAHGGHKIGVPLDFGGVGHRVYTDNGDVTAGFPRIVVVYKYSLEVFTLKVVRVSNPLPF